MRKLIITLLCNMRILIGLIGSGPALALSLGFNPLSPIDVMMGDTFSVEVIVSDLGSEIVSAFDLDVSFDVSLLDATNVTFGTSLGDPFFFEVFEDFNIDNTSGLVDFAAVSLLDGNDLDLLQGDSVLLASLEFDVISSGQTSLSFLWGPGQDVKGWDNQVILPSAPVPEPTTLLLLGTGLVGLAGFRKKFKKA